MEKNKQEAIGYWKYNGEVVTPEMVPAGAIGMIYKIVMYPSSDMRRWIETGHLGMAEEHATKKIYIGKKQLTSSRKKTISKREIKQTKTRKRVRQVVKDSGWMNYSSSNPELKELLKQYPELFTKTILKWCYSKKELSYEETAAQILYDVLRVDSFNGNICGKWYRRDLIKQQQ